MVLVQSKSQEGQDTAGSPFCRAVCSDPAQLLSGHLREGPNAAVWSGQSFVKRFTLGCTGARGVFAHQEHCHSAALGAVSGCIVSLTGCLSPVCTWPRSSKKPIIVTRGEEKRMSQSKSSSMHTN